MRLLRAWESRYIPQETGGLRLTSAKRFRDFEVGAGIGDMHEGGQRLTREAHLTMEWQGPDTMIQHFEDLPIDFYLEFETKPVYLKGIKVGTTNFLQELSVDDSGVPTPFLLCLSHEPESEDEWLLLKDSLPSDRSFWTIVSNHKQLKIEVEYGIYRWLKLNGAASHEIKAFWGPVQYVYDDAPIPTGSEELLEQNALLYKRWLCKRKVFRGQREFRFGFYVSSPEIESLPDYIDIELTRTGMGLFQEWIPPDLWVTGSG
ncbi:MAG: hypothetical protein F4138_03115 [Acidimicrobiia bacterium]|nr:hypothetical protein [Acidimicrobiia bacterium]